MERRERTRTIEEILTELKATVLPIKEDHYAAYERSFPYCNIKILERNNQSSIPNVLITENFTDLKSLEPYLTEGDRSFDGLRIIYLGSEEGLYEMRVQGIHKKHTVGFLDIGAERLLKSNNIHPQIDIYDKRAFDSYLGYIAERLQKEAGSTIQNQKSPSLTASLN